MQRGRAPGGMSRLRAHTRARGYTHSRTHARTHARTNARTHAHTHTAWRSRGGKKPQGQ